jgi:lysophospholipase L1-like esterase
MAMGDSITADGISNGDPLNGVLGRESSGQSYLFWACLISQAKLQFAGIAATGGFTTAQVRATHLPTVLSLRPGMCVVLAGTNDFGNFSDATLFAAWQADMTAMYTALLANGTLPIAATLPATNNVGGTYTKLTQANVWIARTATRLGIPLVDFYGATTADNGNYAAGLNSDNVHPSAAGAKVMGTALWTLLQNVVPQSSVYISQDQPSIDTTRILSNELFLTDTNADGVPDNWSVTQAPTVGLATDTANFGARSGKVWTITRAAVNCALSSSTFTVTPGHKLWFAIKFGTTGVEAAGGSIDLYLAPPNQSTFLVGLFNWPAKDTVGLSPYIMAGEVTMPSGLPSNQINITGQIRTGGTLKLAQVTLVDLTASGIA